MNLYRMHDVKQDGVVPLSSTSEATKWNKQGFGIFWTVNEFYGTERRITNLKKIRGWAVDIDAGTKESMIYKLNRGLVPSLIVETKRGYQAYWKAKDAQKENWNAILLNRLVPFYGSDTNARDIARILRTPGFFHMKDPNDPFLVRIVFEHRVSYSEKQMRSFYEEKIERKEQKQEFLKSKKYFASDDLFENIWHLDCEYALSQISGHEFVKGETFTFRRVSSGNKNISVNGKQTSCWIDKEGRIGSLDKGGPTLFNWLCWYGHTGKAAVEFIKLNFPEVVKNGK